MSWLERLGLLRQRATPAPLPERPADVAMASPMGRPSWNISNITFGNPYLRVPQHQNLRLYEQLVETVPVLNAALERITQLVGCPKICAEDKDGLALFEEWWDALPVNRIQTGGENWFAGWVMDHLLYGRAHAEVLLTADKRDVFGLQELHSRTIELRPRQDAYGVDIVQFQGLGGVPVVLNDRLILTAVHDLRNDSPHGNSLLFGLPFVAEIYEKMLWSLKETWMRYGVPIYHVRYLPPDTLSDPQGLRGTSIVGRISAAVDESIRSRAEGNVRNFVTVGDVEVQIVGAQGESLDIQVPGRHLMEQIVAKTGIPPMLLGLQWATTERMSQVQAGLLSEMIDEIRDHLEAPLKYLFDLRLALVGQKLDYELEWEAPTLTDLLEEAKGDLMRAQADAQSLQVLEREWQLGIRDALDVARARRPELEGLDDSEIRRRLPNLLAEPPRPPAAPQPQPAPPAQLPDNQGDGMPAGMNGNGQGMRSARPLTYAGLFGPD